MPSTCIPRPLFDHLIGRQQRARWRRHYQGRHTCAKRFTLHCPIATGLRTCAIAPTFRHHDAIARLLTLAQTERGGRLPYVCTQPHTTVFSRFTRSTACRTHAPLPPACGQLYAPHRAPPRLACLPPTRPASCLGIALLPLDSRLSTRDPLSLGRVSSGFRVVFVRLYVGQCHRCAVIVAAIGEGPA